MKPHDFSGKDLIAGLASERARLERDIFEEDELGAGYFDNTPVILPEDRLRALIRASLEAWKYARPKEVKAMLKDLAMKRAWYAENNKTAKTGLGEHMPGEIPQFVDSMLAQVLGANYLRTNPKIFGLIFDEFPEGRYAYWEGSGGGKLTLNSGDFL